MNKLKNKNLKIPTVVISETIKEFFARGKKTAISLAQKEPLAPSHVISFEDIKDLENDSTDYIDWSKAKGVSFPKLKPSTKTVSLRIPESLLNDVKGTF